VFVGGTPAGGTVGDGNETVVSVDVLGGGLGLVGAGADGTPSDGIVLGVSSGEVVTEVTWSVGAFDGTGNVGCGSTAAGFGGTVVVGTSTLAEWDDAAEDGAAACGAAATRAGL
jgi:hypothetical protein